MKNDREVCGRCRWFNPPADAQSVGSCHRETPRVVVLSYLVDPVSVWPVVDAADWCGRFEVDHDQAMREHEAAVAAALAAIHGFTADWPQRSSYLSMVRD